MNFNFRLADDNDLSDIMELMNQTRDTICPKEWFVEDTEDSVRHILAGNGFIILAMPQHSEEMAGFFIIKFPGLSEENLGNWIDFHRSLSGFSRLSSAGTDGSRSRKAFGQNALSLPFCHGSS